MLLRAGFTATSTRLRSRSRRSGVTLMETMFGVGIGGLVIGAILSFSFYTSRSFAMMYNYAELEKQSRSALDRMGRDVRKASRLTGFNAHKVTLLDSDSLPLVYEYSPTERTLVRTKIGVSETYLRECDSLNFAIFQRNPIEGTYDQYPASIAATNAKVLQVTWKCSRSVIGSKLNTESLQAAKIVIRNE